jgi:hypothetical protein
VNEKRTEPQKQSAPEPPRKQDSRKQEPECEPEALDEQSLDEVLRDCPL